MLWHAIPPEFNTARLMAGAGPAPMLQAAAGWASLGVALEAQSDQLALTLTALGAAWTGTSGERAIAAATPMVGWLKAVAAQAQKRGLQASAQAAAHTAAVAMTPSLPEIAANHVTKSVLVATNFLGINTMPIGLTETDYFVRMWNQAAGAMDMYQAETTVNTTFEPLPPMKPIVLPVPGAVAEATASFELAKMAANAADPQAFSRAAAGLATAGNVGLQEQLMPFLAEMRDNGTLSQLAQLGTPVQQLIQQLTQSLSQLGNMGGLGEGMGEQAPGMGLMGANPLSTHPLAGGSGPSTGAGLLRADAMPGTGGSPLRTPLLGQMIEKPLAGVAPAAVAAATGAAAGAGSSGMGGPAPMGSGMGGHGAHVGATRTAMAAPAMLADDPGEGDQSFDDEDDW